ncbi:hypothetical protein E2986_14024 [Frieseomelitta varia]|uniref:PWI domain-containing protein n=1 Tax=Frieseomelitta varia TaxID=561572 RepID=A0A833W9T4_9HYME|nr:hypothetical protein E2986_14024 [Frieseomelitta varia]
MIIENPDQFKAWLTAVLEPLCDADPAALAKYVYALVKKDKTLEELRGGMVEQLDVFLQQETKNFVELLFKTLETQEYVLPPPKSDPDGGGTPPGVNPPPPTLAAEKVTESTIAITSMNTNPPAPLQMNGSAPMAIGKRETRKSDSEKIDKEKEKRSRSRVTLKHCFLKKTKKKKMKTVNREAGGDSSVSVICDKNLVSATMTV